MARRKFTTTVRLDGEDAFALRRARKDGLNVSALIREGLRVVAAKYYRTGRRPPTVGYVVADAPDFGEESALFKDFEE